MSVEKTADLVSRLQKNEENDTTRNKAALYNSTGKYTLEKIGLRRRSVGDARNGIYEYVPVNPKGCGISICTHRQREILRIYLNAIKRLGFKNHNYERSSYGPRLQLRKLVDSDSQRAFDMTDPVNDVDTIRTGLVVLRKHFVGNRTAKRLLMQIKPEHHVYYYLYDAYAFLSSQVNAKAEELLVKKHKNRVRINPDFVLQKAISVLEDSKSDAISLVTALLAVTGRRLSEIVKTGEFKVVDGDRVSFYGQLKSRTRNFGEPIPPYGIPVLCDSGLVVKCLRRVRRMLKSRVITYFDVLGNRAEHRLLDEGKKFVIEHTLAASKVFVVPVKCVLSSWTGSTDISAKTLRSMYSEVMYKKFGKKGVSKSAFTAEVLGYSDDTFGAALNYEQIELDYNIDSVVVGGIDKDMCERVAEKLKMFTPEIESNRRQRGMIALHHEIIRRLECGALNLTNVTVSQLRFIKPSGKGVNCNTVKKYAELTGILDMCK